MAVIRSLLGDRREKESCEMQTRAMCIVVVLGTALFMAACGGDDDGGPSSCEELAAIIGDCGGELTEQEFIEGVCQSIVLSGDCLEAAGAADCAEHDEESPSYAATCFPSCSDT